MENANFESEISQLFILGLVVFIAVVMAQMWIDQQRQALAKAQGVQLTEGNRGAVLVTGFSAGV